MSVPSDTMRVPEHGRYPFTPIDARQDYSWPDGKHLAFYVAISVEHFAFGAGIGEDISTPGAPQTQRNFGWRDYGQRVGLWRLLAMLDELGLPAAHAVNALVYRYRPQIAARLHARGDEIIAHARTSSELQTDMWAYDEARIIYDATQAIASARGERPQGWLGPGFGETHVTPDLLKEAGYSYLLDWPADDQPFWIDTRAGPILSIPYPLELEDVTAILHRRHGAREYADMVVNQFETMAVQCERQPLVFALGLHPYVAGQPFRLHALRKALRHCLSHRHIDRVWRTRPGEIAAYCQSLAPGIVP
jgi:peptidoglycan/xylan/chitin deacetylase (PgdA/CDA1 family)